MLIFVILWFYLSLYFDFQMKCLDSLAAYYMQEANREKKSEKKRELFAKATLHYTTGDRVNIIYIFIESGILLKKWLVNNYLWTLTDVTTSLFLF